MNQVEKIIGLKEQKLIDDGSEDKKAKGTKKCVIKRKLKFENYRNCLEATHLDNKKKKKKININSFKKS